MLNGPDNWPQKARGFSEGARAPDRPIEQRTGREDMGGPCTAAVEMSTSSTVVRSCLYSFWAFFLAPFHKLDAECKAEDTTDEIIFSDLQRGRLDFLLCISLPFSIVSEFVIRYLLKDALVFSGLDYLCEPLVDMVFSNLIALLNQQLLSQFFADTHFSGSFLISFGGPFRNPQPNGVAQARGLTRRSAAAGSYSYL